MRIAVLHDDPHLFDTIQDALERHHHVCHGYRSASSLLKDLRHETFDLLVADGHLQDMHAVDMLRRLREAAGQPVPILLITRRNEEREVIEALLAGADDSMAQPLRMGELAARVMALLRRAYPAAMSQGLVFGPYQFHPAQRRVSLQGLPLELKHREYELALFMFRNAGRLMSRAHLREAVWGEVNNAPSRSLDTHVSRLRVKLQLTSANGYTITGVYGTGYRLDAVGPEQDPR